MTEEETGPRRVLALLWGRGGRPRRGPKPTLTVELIVEAATAVADAEGVEAVSMRRVAEQLQVGTASLYTYVTAKDELIALMVDESIARDPLPHTLPGDWREKFAAWARADWHDYRAHPWVIQLVSSAPALGPGAMAWIDSALSVLEGTGLGAPEKFAAISCVDAYVRGQARKAVEDGEPSWQEGHDVFLAEHVDWRDYPAMMRLGGPGRTFDREAEFELGLQCLLDGIEERMARAGGAENSDRTGSARPRDRGDGNAT